MPAQRTEFNHRERATLEAVGRGNAEITSSRVPDLFIDGLACCDQFTAHRLVRDGFIRAVNTGTAGERVPAELSAKARYALEGTATLSA